MKNQNEQVSSRIQTFVEQQQGATEKILAYFS
jgi:hypothetical protein